MVADRDGSRRWKPPPPIVLLTGLLSAGACAAPRVDWPRTPPPERAADAVAPAGTDPVLPESGAARPAVVIHEPFRRNACGTCHVAARGGGMLQAPADRLCQRCHGRELRRARVHPAAARSCLTCHSPHVSMEEGRLVAKEEELCRRCHDPDGAKLARAHQGYPVASARCTRCHDPHGGPAGGSLKAHVHRPALRCTNCHVAPSDEKPLALLRGERETCGRCHPSADPRREAAFEHAPFGAGCSACHEPHASDRAHLLKASERRICIGCHDEIGRRTAARGHAPAAAGACHACHSPHAAERGSLLVADVPGLCAGCHERWHVGREGAARPPEGEGGRCLYCHDPHGTGREMLLRRAPRIAGGP